MAKTPKKQSKPASKMSYGEKLKESKRLGVPRKKLK